jgi:hypothetical protein
MVMMRRLAGQVLRYETLGVQALAPMVADAAWLW